MRGFDILGVGDPVYVQLKRAEIVGLLDCACDRLLQGEKKKESALSTLVHRSEGSAYDITACNGTRELFEPRKELADALDVLQRELRHVDEELAERLPVSTSEREQKVPRDVRVTRR